MSSLSSRCLVAADIGNSRLKFGCFLQDELRDRAAPDEALLERGTGLRDPDTHLSVALNPSSAEFDESALAAWRRQLPCRSAKWLVASVNGRAKGRLQALVEQLEGSAAETVFRALNFRDLPIEVNLPAPQRVGIDRLVAAVAGNELRLSDRGVIVIDHGSAITVDLISAQGVFTGGAILPGLAMAARALAEQTDALPLVDVRLEREPEACGNSTDAAIKAGLYWGSRGAICEIVRRLAVLLPQPPMVLLTGGGAAELAGPIAHDTSLEVRHAPHLILGGIEYIARRLLSA